jgi:glycosyltransferase involved in cell wall biosynthesis
MKIVHLGIGIVPVPPGDIAAGIEEYIFDLTKNLALTGNLVHVIDIKGGSAQHLKRQQSRAIFHTLWRPPIPYKWNFFFLQRYYDYLMYPVDTLQFVVFSVFSIFPLFSLLRNEKIQIIHTHQRDTAMSAVLTNKLAGNKAVVLYTPQRVTSHLPKLLRHIVHLPEILALKYVDQIIALTPAFKEHLVAEYGLDQNKITVISGGGAAFDKIQEFVLKKGCSAPSPGIILCSGMICQRKNQFTAVKAFAQVVKTSPDIKLVLTGKVGEIDYFQAIKRFVDENGLSRCIEFKGEVPKQELYSLYGSASLFLFPTTAEVRPAVIVEALAFGLPIVASNIRANTDLLLEKGCALMVDPQDISGLAGAIINILNDTSLKKNMSEKATQLAQTLSYQNMSTQILALYEKLVYAKEEK